MDKKSTVLKIIWWTYITALFIFVVVKFNGSFSELADRMKYYSSEDVVRYNLIPLKSINTQLRHITNSWGIRNLLGNIVPFIPFGYLIPVVFNKINNYIRVFFAGLITVIGIELFQYVTKLGSLDIDDVILNMIAISIGYGLMKIFFRDKKA